jgi:hypothetical protein
VICKIQILDSGQKFGLSTIAIATGDHGANQQSSNKDGGYSNFSLN